MKTDSDHISSSHTKHIVRIFTRTLLFLTVLTATLALWTAAAEAQAHYTPDYPQIDILPLLQKQSLTEEDYTALFLQTGLTKAGVDQLFAAGQQDALLALQQRFFARVEVECTHDNLFVRSERLLEIEPVLQNSDNKVNKVYDLSALDASICPACDFLPAVQAGDILITFNGHFFGWRSGHAAIVVDAEKGLTLEAIMPGYDSKICSLEDWREYPGFALLRLKNVPLERREQIAAYARESLADLPYSLMALSEISYPDSIPASTQCAHLVWYAYHHFGYDIDSDGGIVVTPADLYKSTLLELVQLYGLSPNS